MSDANSASQQMGQYIREARTRKGFSLMAVAVYLGLKTDSIISHYESGFRCIPPDKLREIAELLDLNLDVLVNMRAKVETDKIISRVYGSECVQ